MTIQKLIESLKERNARKRYDALVDQGRHEGGLTEAESNWMRQYWLKNIADSSSLGLDITDGENV